MLLRSLVVSMSLWAVHIACILVPFRQMALPAYAILFSLLCFPLVCGLFENKLSYGFSRHYFHFVKIGFCFCLLSTISGIVFMLPFAVLSVYTQGIMHIVSGLMGGIGITCWFFLLTRWICLPRFSNLTLMKAFTSSAALAKGHHTRLFLLMIKTYLLCLLIIPAPWAIRSYIRSIRTLDPKQPSSITNLA